MTMSPNNVGHLGKVYSNERQKLVCHPDDGWTSCQQQRYSFSQIRCFVSEAELLSAHDQWRLGKTKLCGSRNLQRIVNRTVYMRGQTTRIQKKNAEARNDFWSMEGDLLPIPLKYIDVTSTTYTKSWCDARKPCWRLLECRRGSKLVRFMDRIQKKLKIPMEAAMPCEMRTKKRLKKLRETASENDESNKIQSLHASWKLTNPRGRVGNLLNQKDHEDPAAEKGF